MTMIAPDDATDARVVTADESIVDPTDLTAAACLFHGLSDVGRLRILQHLLLGEHRVRDLIDHLGLAQSTVSAHVACLRDCGLLAVRREGRSAYYRLAHPAATAQLLRSAEALLGLTGDAVLLCPAHAHSEHDELDEDGEVGA